MSARCGAVLGRAFASLLLITALALGACREQRPETRDTNAKITVPASSATSRGNAARGEALVREFECSRCHEGASAPAPEPNKACADCHRRIMDGAFAAPPESLSLFREHIQHFLQVPALTTTRRKFRRSWLERYLLEPEDLRPGLEETMPRLRMDAERARDIAAFLAPEDSSAGDSRSPGGSLEHGRELLERKGCGTCHRMSGVPPLRASTLPVAIDGKRLVRAMRGAPDLAFARERLLAGYLERWLQKPSAVDPDALMPDIPLSNEEVRDIATYLREVRLGRPARQAFTRLPVLTRSVKFGDVKARVFRKTCWHCHSDPDYAIGDGGPGNTGGFGFSGRGINLAEHESVLSGYLDDGGRRRSLFVPDSTAEGSANISDGRLIRALLARHEEEQGRPVPGVRGMPLGLPALTAEDIQLVETWISQGRPM